jgi:2,4-didehydro-3-deoxy-L-rhamnonate hydrolase
MKLLRFGPKGREKPGLLDGEGTLRDLSGVISDIDRTTLGNGEVARLKKVKPDSLPKVTRKVRIGAPIREVRNFIAIGLNYADHARETGAQIPKEPIIFAKAPSCLNGPNDDIQLPRGSKKTDWEVELAIVIGKGGSYIDEAKALSHVAGYTICHDVSEREYQMDRGGSQWTKGKGCPTFGPLGPWLVTPDEIKDPQDLDMFLDVDGKRMQTGNTKTMIFGVKFLVSHISQFFMLEPGDVITTGTPPGVGQGMKPPRFLKGGETVRLGIAGLGEQAQHVVA